MLSKIILTLFSVATAVASWAFQQGAPVVEMAVSGAAKASGPFLSTLIKSLIFVLFAFPLTSLVVGALYLTTFTLSYLIQKAAQAKRRVKILLRALHVLFFTGRSYRWGSWLGSTAFAGLGIFTVRCVARLKVQVPEHAQALVSLGLIVGSVLLGCLSVIPLTYLLLSKGNSGLIFITKDLWIPFSVLGEVRLLLNACALPQHAAIAQTPLSGWFGPIYCAFRNVILEAEEMERALWGIDLLQFREPGGWSRLGAWRAWGHFVTHMHRCGYFEGQSGVIIRGACDNYFLALQAGSPLAQNEVVPLSDLIKGYEGGNANHEHPASAQAREAALNSLKSDPQAQGEALARWFVSALPWAVWTFTASLVVCGWLCGVPIPVPC